MWAWPWASKCVSGRSHRQETARETIREHHSHARPNRARFACHSRPPPPPAADRAPPVAATLLALTALPLRWPRREPAGARRRGDRGLRRRHRAPHRRADHARDPARPRLPRRPAAARVPAVALVAAGGAGARARQHRGRHRPAFRLGGLPGARPQRQRLRAARRLRRRAPRPDRDDQHARRAGLGAGARAVARHAAPHRAQHHEQQAPVADRHRRDDHRRARGQPRRQRRRGATPRSSAARRRRSRAS